MQKGHWEEAQEMFDQITASESMSHTFDPEDFRRIKGAHHLTAREQAILRELYIWRDQESRRRDRPPFKVLSDRVLIGLAQARPRGSDTLARVDGMKPYHVRRYGERILRAVRRGMHARPPHPPPPPPRHSEAQVARFQALRAWRKRVAARRGVDVDVVVSNATLWALAEQHPRTVADLASIEGLGPWKRKTYGEAILSVLVNW
jgi:ribonuclease D